MSDEKSKVKLKHKIPIKVGAAVDLLFKVRSERKRIQAQAEAMKAQEELIEEKIFGMFKKQDLDGARGKAAQASVSTSDVPVLEHWELFEPYVIKNKALHLFQRRLSVEACRELWQDKKGIPGVGVFTKVRLHLTKAG